MTTGSPRTPPSWVRITLLVALGATIGVAFTDAGHFAAKRCLAKVTTRPDIRLPLTIEVATGSDSRYAELYRAVRDIAESDDVDSAAQALAPTPQRVAERLTAIAGWSTAVLFEPGSSASSLRDAGLDDTTTCVVLAGQAGGLFRHGGPYGVAAMMAQSPVRSWWLVLLDSAGRQIGMTSLHAVRPGLVPYYVGGERVYMHSGEAPDDDECPPVVVFHRTAEGEIVTG